MASNAFRAQLLSTSRRSFCVGLALTTLAASLAAEAPRNSNMPTLTPPKITGPIPVTRDSMPFGTTMVLGSYSAELMHAHDYVEEEYFLSGHANIYGPGTIEGLSVDGPHGMDPDLVTVQMKPLSAIFAQRMPYSTRMLLLRPRDNARFSGRVHLYAFHNLAARMPIERNLLENGDVLACIEGCSGTRFGVEEVPSGGVAHLHKANQARYRTMGLADASPAAWPDLKPGRLGEAYKTLNFSQLGKSSNVFLQEIYRSYAQAPDIVSQAARAFKMGHRSLPFGNRVRYLFSYAASGGTNFLEPYIEHHHDKAMLPDGRPPFDGYLVMVGLLSPRMPKGAVFAYINSQADLITTVKSGTVFPPDSDSPRVRVYEVPGTGHSISAPLPEVTAASGGTELAGAADMVPKGVAGLSDRDAPPPGVIPYDKVNAPIIWGTWSNMYDWIEKGIPMPRVPRITRDPAKPDGIAVDQYGAALGGLRTPWVDVPEASYLPRISPKNPLRAGMRPFSEDKIKELYGSRENYQRLVNQKIDELVEKRLVRPQYADLMRRSA